MSKISTWSTTAANNNSASPNGFPEGMAPSGLNNGIRELMSAVRTQHEQAAWIDLGDTPTRTSDTQFTVVGDQTAQYTVGRRIRITDTATLYGTITVSAYTSLTTVTVSLDSGAITTPTAVALNIVDSKTLLLLDEDDMASDSQWSGATQQSIKAYADSVVSTHSSVTETHGASGAIVGATTLASDIASAIATVDKMQRFFITHTSNTVINNFTSHTAGGTVFTGPTITIPTSGYIRCSIINGKFTETTGSSAVPLFSGIKIGGSIYAPYRTTNGGSDIIENIILEAVGSSDTDIVLGGTDSFSVVDIESSGLSTGSQQLDIVLGSSLAETGSLTCYGADVILKILVEVFDMS